MSKVHINSGGDIFLKTKPTDVVLQTQGTEIMEFCLVLSGTLLLG